VIAALDIGGTHVSAARIDADLPAVVTGSRVRIPFAADASRDHLVDAIRRAAASVSGPGVCCFGVATAGPFDYERGICLIQGLAKLEALYGVDLRAQLGSIAAGVPVVFLNDAEAFLLGEAWAGAARGRARAVGITLGSGLGSAFLADGRIVREGADVPPGGSVHLLTYRGGPVEDSISRRALLRGYGAAPGCDVADIADRAHRGEASAVAVFVQLAQNLAEFVAPLLASFRADCLVVGGSIARAWTLIGPALEQGLHGMPVCVALNLDDAPLLGAARHARMQASSAGRGPSSAGSRG
jgi:glucokinase